MIVPSINNASSSGLQPSISSSDNNTTGENRTLPSEQVEEDEKKNTHQPKADARKDQIVQAGESVTLDWTASSDRDGDKLTYKWTQIDNDGSGSPSVTLPDDTSSQPTFVAPSPSSLEEDAALKLKF